MKRKILTQKFLAFALTASVVAGMCPTSAFAVTGSQVAADGTYTSTAHVTRNENAEENEDTWNEYDVEVSLTVKDGKITDIVTTPGNGYTSDDAKYVRWSTTDTKHGGINTKIVGKDATADSINSWDTVSGATCTSKAVKEAAAAALSKAEEKKDAVTIDTSALESAIANAEKLSEDDYTAATWSTLSSALTSAKSALTAKESQEAVNTAADNLNNAINNLVKQEYVYCYAGLTWAEYWANEGVYNSTNTSSNSKTDLRGESDKGGFDTVTRATTNHGLHRGSFQCTAIVDTEEGTTLKLSYWKTNTVKGSDGKDTTQQIAVMTDGTEYVYAKGKFTKDSTTLTLKDYKVTGLKYVPVKVKAEDYNDFKAKYTVYVNGATLVGGYAEGVLSTIKEVANVTKDTNGLKTATKNADGSFTFSAKQTGTDSGIKDQSLKTATGLEPTVKEADGSYGEFLRVDFNGNYGDIASNLQTVKWTYYGNDSTRTKAVATYGTKFAADNWMHKKMGIQLGLTDSYRCTIPSGYDGTGYWSITLSALGYEDYTYDFVATSDNIVTSADEGDITALEAKVAEAEKLVNKTDVYTASSLKDLQGELAEAKEEIAKTEHTKPIVEEALSHLTDAISNLKSQYVLMNIPYADFYKADLNNDVAVDAFTSATKSKTKSGSLAAGSYHTSSSGDAINGVAFPVKVTDDFYNDNKNTQITDESSVDITTTMRGTTTTTTYKGKDALFESADYSYYQLTEVPSYYKEISITDGTYSFGKTNGTVTTLEASTVTATLSTESNYGDYELDLDGIKTAMGYADNETASVYGVVVSTKEGTDYGMRHIENIWRVEELAWSTGFTTQVHGCTTSSDHYESMMGKTINKVTYYTNKGIFVVAVGGDSGLYVPIKSADATVADVENAKISDGKTEAQVSIPEGFDPEYTVLNAAGKKAEGFTVTEKTTTDAASGVARALANATATTKTLVISFPSDADNNSYTLSVSDKNGKYASFSKSFELYADSIPAKYNEDSESPKLVMADDATAAQFADFIGKIKTVNVNGKDYPASGRGAVAIIKADGTIDTTAAPFTEGSEFAITVTATGYADTFSFTYVKPVVIDTSKLSATIEKASTLKEADYTADSWKTFSDMLASAKAVLENADDQTKVDTATASLEKAMESLVKKTQEKKTAQTVTNSNGTGNTTTATTAKTTVKKSAKTSDNNPVMAMVVVMIAAAGMIAAVLLRRKTIKK